MESVAMTVSFNDPDEVLLEFPDEALTVSVPITCVGPDLYRLEAVPHLSTSAGYADIVEAIATDEGNLRFVRVAQSSGWSTHAFIMSADRIQGDPMQGVLRDVLDNGGYWEQVFGGCLVICLPPGSAIDPEKALSMEE
jgi:hypothetical protein